eukprot:1150927-Pelagomonas_calceolata.AAC.2
MKQEATKQHIYTCPPRTNAGPRSPEPFKKSHANFRTLLQNCTESVAGGQSGSSGRIRRCAPPKCLIGASLVSQPARAKGCMVICSGD